MSHKDQATREALASELGELKDKYSQLEQAYSQLKHQTFSPQQEQFEDTLYQKAKQEAASELGHS